MKPPKVSILIPTYNYARFLPDAIESVLAQDFSDYELLIIDDGSTDNTREVLERYAARDRRVRFSINPKNLGLASNWNLCLKQARGEYIKYLFGDDKLTSPQSLRKLVAMLDENPSAALAASARRVIDEASQTTEVWDFFRPAGLCSGMDVIAQCLLEYHNLIGEPSVVLFRRECAARGFDVQYRQIVDLEMWFHLIEHRDMVYSAEPLSAFRKHSQQQTLVNAAEKVGQREMLQLWSEYLQRPWIWRSKYRFTLFWRLYQLRRYPLIWKEWKEAELFKRELMRGMGRSRYIAYYVHYKVTNPVVKLIRHCRKLAQRKRLQ